MKPAGKIKRKNDILKEQRTLFEVPRKSCEEIVPEMVRLKKDKKNVQKHRLHIIRDIFVKCRMKNIKKHLKHIVELDKSDAIIPHGEVSKRLYENIFNAREFDLYGRIMKNDKKNVRKQEEIQKMAQYLGLKFEKDIVPDEIVKVPSLFGNVTDDLGAPAIRTEKHEIGYMDEPFAPVGVARNPATISRSYGNDLFFSYKGSWNDGMMNGYGKYKFLDGMFYQGSMKNNAMDGNGVSSWPTSYNRPRFYDERFEDEKKKYAEKMKKEYEKWNKPTEEKKDLSEAEEKELEEKKKAEEEENNKKEEEEEYDIHDYFKDGSYEGDWKNSRFNGMGVLRTASDSEYKGAFYMGRRHGEGLLKYSCGLVYEGEWLDGKPHGRGKMWSKLHGYVYEGTFKMGRIQDSGVLTTPTGERIVQYWPERDHPVLLPTLVRHYIIDQENYKRSLQRRVDQRYAGLRGEQLHLYVEAIRKRIHYDKMQKKKEKFNENLKKLKEQKERLHEARLKALGV